MGIRLRRIISKATEDRERAIPDDADLPSVSIVVYAHDDASFLEKLLPRLLAQRYPSQYEIVVVNEGQSDATSDLVNAMALSHPNLYLTFTPDGARNLSRKKLALTLGIKASRSEVVVMVDADTSVDSDEWLLYMASGFADPACDVVIGTSIWDWEADDMHGSRYRAFDSVADAVTYLAPAINGHPYRGTSHNLAYRRQLFFANKGFSKSLNLRYGDDDIFLSEIATSDNTRVELSAQSITRTLFHNPSRNYKEAVVRRMFTAPHVKSGSRRLMAFCSILLWLWLLSSATAVVYALPSLLPAAVVVLLCLLLWIPLAMWWRKTMLMLGSRRLGLTLPWLIMMRPFHTIMNQWRTLRSRKYQYTWN